MKSKRANKIEIIVPEMVQDFVLAEKLGTGSFGEIYKA